MKPKIDGTSFGSITVDGKTFKNDIIIRIDGQVLKRNKNLSKAIYGTSHIISLDEAQDLWEEGAENLIIGAGVFGKCRTSEDADSFFEQKGCKVVYHRNPKAVKAWNMAGDTTIGLFHITC